MSSRRASRTRPGYFTILVVSTFAVMACIALGGHLFFDEASAAEYRAQRAQALVEVEHQRRGWRSAFDDGSVEFLVASRAFEIPLEQGVLRASAPDAGDAGRVMDVVRSELGRYPGEFLQRVGLRRVLLCSGLTEGAEPIPSLPNFEATLVLDVTARGEFLRRLVHHEVFHFVDFRDDGHVGGDVAWEALNPAGFCYGAGGRAVRDRDASLWSDESAGVLSFYSLSALEEDKAELFSFVMASRDRVADRARRDDVVRRKLTALRGQLDASFPLSLTGFFPF